MSDPYTQGLYQLRTVKGEPLEFCLYTQNPYPLCSQMNWEHKHTPMHIRISHTLNATSHHTVPAAHNPKMVMATCFNKITVVILALSHETVWLPCLSLCLFCHFEVSECMLLYIFGDASEWFNLVLFFYLISWIYSGIRVLHHWLFINRTVGI